MQLTKNLTMKILRNKLPAATLLLIVMLISSIGKSTNANIPKSVNDIASVPMIRVKMSGLVNSLDETVIYYQSGATNGFDSDFDSYKLFGPNPAPHISQMYNSTLMAINGIEPVLQTFSINLLATTNTTGNFTITATDYLFLPKGTCVYLYDSLTNTTTDLLGSTYSFTLSNTTTAPRFTIKITHYQLNTICNLQQPTCQDIFGGGFKIIGFDNGPWNYIWKDSTGTIIRIINNSNNTDSLSNLSPGYYNVTITSANNGCYYSDTTFYITPIILPTVAFISQDSITVSAAQNYTVQNQSTNCESFQWFFGDGLNYSNDFEPTYNYSLAGTYSIKLIGTSMSGCIDSLKKSINVIDISTYLNTVSGLSFKVIDIGNNQFKILPSTNSDDEIAISISSLEGKYVFNQTYKIHETKEIILNLNNLYGGMYLLNIEYRNRNVKSTKIFIKQ